MTARNSISGIEKFHFSGHETFALRYGWLKKAYDAVVGSEIHDKTSNGIFGDTAIAHFGVGKNMVSSIRFWAKTVGVIVDNNEGIWKPTEFGNMIFDPKTGLDPYMENHSTLWLIHWKLASSNSRTTTWNWTFNHFSRDEFDRESLIKFIMGMSVEKEVKVSINTLNSDVGCFLNTYAVHPGKIARHEDALDCPLIELDLIQAGTSGKFYLSRGPKMSLKRGVFAYALCEFWDKHSPDVTTLSFDEIVYAPGSPGRVFLLHASDVEKYLEEISKATKGRLQWSEVAGLRQVIRKTSKSSTISQSKWPYAAADFHSHGKKKVA